MSKEVEPQANRDDLPDTQQSEASAFVENGGLSQTNANRPSRELPGSRSNFHPSRFADLKTTQRKPTPSPLQSSQTSTFTERNSGQASSERGRQQTSSRTPASHQRSLLQSSSTEEDRPQSPKERLDALLATEGSIYNSAERGSDPRSVEFVGSRKGSLTSPKATSYSQLRNVSSPVPFSHSPRGSPPTSPTMSTDSKGTQRPDQHPMPRTSSIDSAISSISSNTSHSYKSSQDSFQSHSADISTLIAAAGSPEAVIQHLLKEKQHSAAQNAQLWRLVDKQRSLVIGLNKDLERALKDKERYRKKLKEHLAQVPPVPSTTSRNMQEPQRSSSESPVPSDRQKVHPIPGDDVRDIVHRAITGMNETSEGIPEAHGSRLIPTIAERSPATSPSPAWLNAEAQLNDPLDQLDAKIASLKQAHEVATPLIARSHTSNPRGTERGGSIQSLPETPYAIESAVSPTSFAAKRSLPLLQKPHVTPSLAIIEASPLVEKGNTSFPPPRKPPPAPLDFNQPVRASPHLHQLGPEDHSGSDYDDILEVDEIPAFERGRRKTREEDDKERETAALKAQESRSLSKKNKSVKPSIEKAGSNMIDGAQPTTNGTAPQLARQMVPQSPPASAPGFLSPPGSLAAALNAPCSEPPPSIQQRILSAPPMSPGLPISPRPGDRPMNSPLPRMPREGINISLASPPLSPRGGFPGLPLSPRAPKQPIPYPPNTPVSITSPELPRSEAYRPSSPAAPTYPGEDKARLPVELQSASAPENPGASTATRICHDLVSREYPDLLLPPNALPSIEVKVCSSRLRPSRHSYLASKNSEEGAVFTLGIFARSDRRELWRVEKILMALPQLDYQLKQCSSFNASLPDRALFSGHAPARIDARRIALNRYFEIMLNTPMDEKAAFVVCHFLSTDAIEPQGDEASMMGAPVQTKAPVTGGTEGRTRKEGYLTKRGKNFGGWKARFFVLDGPVLRYYESPGGAHLGTIKLQAAQIGKQSQHQSSQSPSRNVDDIDNQYRHAFLILEPKRKDSNSVVRHVLCAESDAERDDWVGALLQYVDYQSSEDERKRPTIRRNESGSGKTSSLQARDKSFGSGRKDSDTANSPEFENADALQSLSYEDTVAADAPVLGSMQNGRHFETPSPPMTSAQSGHQGPGITDFQPSKSISGPTNGGFIQDAGAWGNKPPATNRAKDKEHKKRSFWGFKARSSTDLAIQAQGDSAGANIIQHHNDRTGAVKAVFGVPLAEAVENCPPTDIYVHLPAVVYRCIEYLDAKDVASEEGIFRLSGSNVVIKALRERFNVEGDVDFLADDHYYDVHAVASLLKLYLRELPATVLTRELHLDFLQVLDLDEKEKKVLAYNGLVRKLPQANWSLLRALSAFLLSIVSNSDVNKMTVRNVGIVFSPTLNIPAPIFSMFLTEFDDIFGSEFEGGAASAVQTSISESLAPEDVRSPRRQMFSEIPTPMYSQETFPIQERSYEQVVQDSRAAYDTGFIPMQPFYDQPIQGQNPYAQSQEGSVTVAGP
ncbi:MAG: hypothetical protein M1830_010636, partial [Pleopsidium flavum]